MWRKLLRGEIISKEALSEAESCKTLEVPIGRKMGASQGGFDLKQAEIVSFYLLHLIWRMAMTHPDEERGVRSESRNRGGASRWLTPGLCSRGLVMLSDIVWSWGNPSTASPSLGGGSCVFALKAMRRRNKRSDLGQGQGRKLRVTSKLQLSFMKSVSHFVFQRKISLEINDNLHYFWAFAQHDWKETL